MQIIGYRLPGLQKHEINIAFFCADVHGRTNVAGAWSAGATFASFAAIYFLFLNVYPVDCIINADFDFIIKEKLK